MQNSAGDTFEYEDLAALYRVEKKSPSLSAVRRDLYPSMAKLLKGLNAEYMKQLSADPDSLVCEGINQRRKKARQISKEIIEQRMQKICSLALRGAMGAQNVIEQLTSEEKDYYNEVLNASKRHASILTHLSGERKYESVHLDEVPEPKKDTAKVAAPASAPTVQPVKETVLTTEDDFPIPLEDEFGDGDFAPEADFAKEDAAFAAEPPKKMQDAATGDRILIRILEDLPEFSGPDRDYRLSREDVVMMPKVMADALVNRGKAVCLHPAA